MKIKFIAILAVFVAVAPSGCSSKTADKSGASSVRARNDTLTSAQLRNIRLCTVKAARFRKTVEATGTVDFDQNRATAVLSPISGPVSKLPVPLGARVKAAEVLAEVSSPDFAAALSAYRKAIVIARTARKLADLDKDLLKHQGVSRREADQARSDAASAEADCESALKSIESLRVDRRTIRAIREGKSVPNPNGLIRSPIAGTVVEKLITPGELLQAGSTPCFTVADLSRVWVMAHLFGSEVAKIEVGDRAEVLTGPEGKNLTGKVDNISAEVDPDTRSVAVRVVVPNPGGVLKKQMYVRLRIYARRESTGLLVPVSAVLRDSENLPFVYVAQPHGEFARRHVSPGYRTANDYEITGGIRAGDRVVVEGGIFVQFLQDQNQ